MSFTTSVENLDLINNIYFTPVERPLNTVLYNLLLKYNLILN